MKRVLTASILSACASIACASQRISPGDESGWSIYRNAKYGYQIGYPDGYELRETGREGERDGRSIRIGMKEYAAPTPVLDLWLHPAGSLYEMSSGERLKDMRAEAMDVEIGGQPARQVEFRWRATGELAFVEIHGEDVLIRFHASPGLREFEGTIWRKIVSTFQLHEHH